MFTTHNPLGKAHDGGVLETDVVVHVHLHGHLTQALVITMCTKRDRIEPDEASLLLDRRIHNRFDSLRLQAAAKGRNGSDQAARHLHGLVRSERTELSIHLVERLPIHTLGGTQHQQILLVVPAHEQSLRSGGQRSVSDSRTLMVTIPASPRLFARVTGSVHDARVLHALTVEKSDDAVVDFLVRRRSTQSSPTPKETVYPNPLIPWRRRMSVLRLHMDCTKSPMGLRFEEQTRNSRRTNRYDRYDP